MFRPLVLIAVVAFSRTLGAQAISVSVRDTSGAPLTQVGLVLMDSRGRVVANARTGTSGIAHLPKADSGTYRVLARRVGFRPVHSDYFHLTSSDTIAVRLTLERVAVLLDQITVAWSERRGHYTQRSGRSCRRHFP